MVKFSSRGLVLAALALVILLAFPWNSLQDHSHWSRVGWIPFFSPPINPVDVVGNVLLTMPAGVAIGAIGGGPAIAALIVAPVSLLCEWAQVYSHGRFPSATDLACNVAGAAVGAALFAYRQRSVIE